MDSDKKEFMIGLRSLSETTGLGLRELIDILKTPIDISKEHTKELPDGRGKFFIVAGGTQQRSLGRVVTDILRHQGATVIHTGSSREYIQDLYGEEANRNDVMVFDPLQEEDVYNLKDRVRHFGKLDGILYTHMMLDQKYLKQGLKPQDIEGSDLAKARLISVKGMQRLGWMLDDYLSGGDGGILAYPSFSFPKWEGYPPGFLKLEGEQVLEDLGKEEKYTTLTLSLPAWMSWSSIPMSESLKKLKEIHIGLGHPIEKKDAPQKMGRDIAIAVANELLKPHKPGYELYDHLGLRAGYDRMIEGGPD